MGLTAGEVRVDRRLAEAHDSGGDPLSSPAWSASVTPPRPAFCPELGPPDQASEPDPGPCHRDRTDEQAIPILHVADAAPAVACYQRLGFTKEWEHRFAPGLPALVSVARGPARLLLSEHTGDAVQTPWSIRIRDVDVIAAEVGVTVAQAPCAREIALCDPDGNRLRIGTPTS